ncbi:MAG: hypothetical protein AAGG44_00535 [Planctomycetota bacterium]
MSKLIDQQALNAFVGEDQEMLDELTAVYGQVLSSDLEQLSQASEAGDCNRTAEIAERFQGRFECFSAAGLTGLAEELRSLAEEERLGEADKLVTDVCDGALALLDELRDLTDK